MSFYKPEQRVAMTSYFQFEDGITRILKVTNVSEENFASGKWDLFVNIEDVETGASYDKVKYQFDFVNALDKLPYETDGKTLKVEPRVTGTKPNKSNPDKPYTVWGFVITEVDAKEASDEAKMDDIFGKK